MPVTRRQPYWVHSDPDARPRPQQRCARAEKCADAETGDDGTQSGAWTERTFCDRDTRNISRCIAGAPEQWVTLHLEIGNKRQQAADRVSGSRTPPIPLRADVDALLREYVSVFASWDERVRAAAGLTLPDTGLSRRRRDAVALAAAARLLAAHLDRLLGLPAEPMARAVPLHRIGDDVPEGVRGRVRLDAGYADVPLDLSGADAGLEILGLHYRGRRLAGLTRRPAVVLSGVPCKQCDLVELAEPQDRPQYKSECGSCGHLMTAAEYSSWVGQYAAYVRITAREAS